MDLHIGIYPSEAGENFVRDYAIVPTRKIIRRTESYKNIVCRIYRRAPKNEGAIDLSRALVIHKMLLEDKV